MRRCLLIAAFLLLTAPAAASADVRATTKLSSTPQSVPAGQPWKVVLTIHQAGRAPRSDLAPAIVIRDADGFASTFPAKAVGRPGRYVTTVTFPRAGQWSYAIRDGISTTPPRSRSVVIKAPAPLVDRPDPVGPTGLPIALAALLALGGAAYVLVRRHRDRTTGPAHPA
jgi:hypothetical protein